MGIDYTDFVLNPSIMNLNTKSYLEVCQRSLTFAKEKSKKSKRFLKKNMQEEILKSHLD